MSAESRIAQDVADRQVTMFAMFVGPGCSVTRAALARVSGVPESTLKNYATGAGMPLSTALTLSKFLPAEAIAMLTEPAGVRFATIESSDGNWDGIAANAAGLTFEICDARKDGVVDHVEAARLRRRARNLIAELSGIVDD